jgi:hypothetical protein
MLSLFEEGVNNTNGKAVIHYFSELSQIMMKPQEMTGLFGKDDGDMYEE